jgi:hypothetical protein
MIDNENHFIEWPALKNVEKVALEEIKEAKETVRHIQMMANIPFALLSSLYEKIQDTACVALHFHPDRIVKNNITIAESLLYDGCYRNQFDTNFSNGHLESMPGGPRDIWETYMFNISYEYGKTNPEDRPKYGSLDLMRSPGGPSPRFGSCYFILHPRLSKRSTFTYLDSHRKPRERGTLEVFDQILAALLSECFERDYALGRTHIKPVQLTRLIRDRLSVKYENLDRKFPSTNLDHYVEAHVHGKIELKSDVLILVADPSFRDTEIGEILKTLSEKFGIKLLWHRGYKLHVSQVPRDFRGPCMPFLANLISNEGFIDAATLGRAAAKAMNITPSNTKLKSSFTLQDIKYLWHILVKYGSKSDK